ncbi:HAD family hydrolase [Breznakiella homolactica]|uniref:HAD family phosphatase n=1 Tax=Breznakiella homolactica TaxID=2798577 RepID=A0A7T7XQH6_9SPIR|nr:HAD family phosphatase [Breznakiella homolactica]QQO10584.1 HAD family phosphatase [Breznakiella homolactica]
MKLFIFDMGGVVVHNVMIIPQIAAELGITADDFFRGAGSDPSVTHTSPYHLGDIAAFMKGEITTEQFWANFTGRTGIAVQGDPWYKHFSPVIDEGTVAVIKDLKNAGYRVVCGTNSLDAHYRRHQELGDYGCFDKVYASQLMGIIKPDPEFWNRILREENIEPKDAFFTDDFEENTEAAKKLGITAHLFTDAAELRKAAAPYLR